MSDSLDGTGDIVYEPTEEFVEQANVSEFMAEHGIGDYEELHRRSTTEIDGVEDSGLEWFWDEIVDTLGLEFDEPYEAVRDDSEVPQFAEWYVGGTLNIAHNVVDRHADPQSETRNKVATIWEGEDG
ncbi:MAG: acetyl-CoA synthetase, partial [Natronomonas sp.]